MTRKGLQDTKPLIIANPLAGGKNIFRKWDQHFSPLLKKHLTHFEVAFTQHAGQATELTRSALTAGYNSIVALGGDGTLNEVVNGFFKNKALINPAACLGILPSGSGGDFIRTLKFERSWEKALHHLTSKKTKKIDVGLITFAEKKLEARYFINIAEVGLGAVVMQYVNAKNRKWPALARYLSGTVQGFRAYKNMSVDLIFDDQEKLAVNLTNLIVANGQYFGRGMRPAPQASLNDGLLDVLVIKNLNGLNFLMHFPQIYARKKNMATHILETFKTKKLTLTVSNKKQKIFCEMDGETCGHGDLTVEVVPGAINLCV